MRGRINFRAGAIQHVYQNTHNGFLVFYSVRDCLVFFTIISIVARQYNVRILGICLMVDHIHLLVEVPSQKELSRFVDHYTAWFAQVQNIWYGRKGSLFRSPFGFTSKVTDKDIRNAIAYLYNNPVEKQMCLRPEQAHWNFLAYGADPHPFSEKIRLAKASAPLRRAVKEVTIEFSEGRPLNYALLKRITKPLNPKEQQQLTDFIVSTYNCIDFSAVAGYFGDYDDLVQAVNTTKGSEYNMKEDFTVGSDRIYSKMSEFLLSVKAISHIDELLRQPEEKRRELLEPLAIRTGASAKQVAKYLRLILTEDGD